MGRRCGVGKGRGADMVVSVQSQHGIGVQAAKCQGFFGVAKSMFRLSIPFMSKVPFFSSDQPSRYQTSIRSSAAIPSTY